MFFNSSCDFKKIGYLPVQDVEMKIMLGEIKDLRPSWGDECPGRSRGFPCSEICPVQSLNSHSDEVLLVKSASDPKGEGSSGAGV